MLCVLFTDRRYVGIILCINLYHHSLCFHTLFDVFYNRSIKVKLSEKYVSFYIFGDLYIFVKKTKIITRICYFQIHIHVTAIAIQLVCCIKHT